MKYIGFILFLALSGCVHESAIPLSNDTAEIDVSTAPVYGRAGAVRIAMENAAKFTLQMGYDKFMVVDNGDWNEQTAAGGSFGSGSAYGNANNFGASSSQSSGFAIFRHPESKMIIKMFHKGDKNSSKAVDAQAYLNMQGGNQTVSNGAK